MLKAVIALILLLPVVAWADEKTSECKLPANTDFSVRNYYSKSTTFTETDPLCDGKGAGLICRQYGLLYLPRSVVKRPAVIINHGRDEDRKAKAEFCATVEYFLNQGFVVFVPRRRGIDSDLHPHTNTGINFDDTLDAVMHGRIPAEAAQLKKDCHLKEDKKKLDDATHRCVLTQLARGETLELRAAINWLRALRHPDDGFKTYVDSKKILLLGHSRGAIISLYAGIDLPDYFLPALVIALDASEKGWKNSGWGLMDAIDKVKVPVMLFQPGNAVSVDSTKELGTRLAAARKPFLAEKLPNVPLEDPSNPQKGVHNGIFMRADQVARWGPLALTYMKLYDVVK
jgi:hypothetical protein